MAKSDPEAQRKSSLSDCTWLEKRPVRLAYQPSASSTFLTQQTSHQQPATSTLLSEQTSTSHQPTEQAVSLDLLILSS
jgi:hypothetical protein